jgi:hypothetical protein
MSKIITWNDLETIDHMFKRKKYVPINIERSISCEKKYEQFKKELDANNISSYDFILGNILKNNCYVIVPNAFPYNLENNVEHWLCWVHPNCTSKITKSIVKDIVSKQFPENAIIVWQNHPSIQSVLFIKHFHVFVKV